MAPPESPTPPDAGSPARPYPPGGPSAEDQARLRAALLALRTGLLRSNKDLADEALQGSGQDFSIDHMADSASDSSNQEISISLLAGETQMLEAIERAIHKIDGRADLPFGVCERCAEESDWDPETSAPWIPTGRLDAVPYARLCVMHQEEQEEN